MRSALMRRALVAPLILGIEFALLVFAPFLAVASAVLSLLFGGRRPIRVLALVLAWASTHIASVGACVVLARGGHRDRTTASCAGSSGRSRAPRCASPACGSRSATRPPRSTCSRRASGR